MHTTTMFIPVEHICSERQRIPAVLVGIEKGCGLIKYSLRSNHLRVPLSELQLAPSAFDPYNNEEEPIEVASKPPGSVKTSHVFSARDPVEVWLSTKSTTRGEHGDNAGSEEDGHSMNESPFAGAWWPGRVLAIQGGFAHVEVAAPLAENGSTDELSSTRLLPHVVRVGSVLPYRSTLVKLEEIRPPWSGRLLSACSSEPSSQVLAKDQASETHFLASPGVLHRHTVCIPAYLARLAASPDSHSALLKFCGAPCLVQCDAEPFLANVLAKRILADCDSASVSGRQTPNRAADSDTVPLVAVSIDSQSSVSPSWPSASLIAQCTILNAPNIAGTLSSAGVTDPTLLLEGLPGANGPLVLLHIWSGSSEAIRRAALLELAHVRILVFRYHVLRKLSNGEPGGFDLADSTEFPAESGDAPAMHCKPISIPIQNNSESSTTVERPGGIMIGYSAQFRIQPQLIGLAIGYRGATIQEARGLPGVRSVDLLHDGIVHVEAETVEACQAVRNLLDFTEAEIPVSPRLASRLIGSKGMNIRKLAASAGVRRAQLLDPLMRKRRQQQLNRQYSIPADQNHIEATGDPSQEMQGTNGNKPQSEVINPTDGEGDEETAFSRNEKLPPPAFYLLGTRSAVAKMRLLLEFQADNWNELDELEEARRNLFSQLRLSSQSVRNNYAPTGPPEAFARGGPTGFRGRARQTSGPGGSTNEAHDPDSTNTSVGIPNVGRPRNQRGAPEPSQSDGTSEQPQPIEGIGEPVEKRTNPEGPGPGWRRIPGPRGRGRNKPRDPTTSA